MGKHTSQEDPGSLPPLPPLGRDARAASGPTGVRAWLPGLLLVAVSVLAVVAAVVAAVGPSATVGAVTRAGDALPDLGGSDPAAEQARSSCRDQQEVVIATTTSMAPALDVLRESPPEISTPDACVQVSVVAQTPAATLERLSAEGEAQQRPDVWVPDSSLWAARAADAGVGVTQAGRLGSSPVLVATSSAAVDALGWADDAPTWAEALGNERPLAVADLTQDAGTLIALGAARQSSPEGAELAAVATLNQERGGAVDPSEAIEQVLAGGADAPLVLMSEQEVRARQQGTGATDIVAVAPSDATPVLDFPVLTVAAAQARTGAMEEAVAAVTEALLGAPGDEVAAAAGLRSESMEALPGTTPLVEVSAAPVGADPEELAALAADLQTLATPTRVLVAVDVSLSMSAPVGDGFTRADIAAQALSGGLGDLPDSFEAGMWQFASDLEGDQDYREVLPVRRLDADGGAQRDALEQQVAQLPASLVDGGTALYDTIDAAVTASEASAEESTRSYVIVVTDGKNEDSDGMTQEALTARLQQRNPDIWLVLVAFGADADLGSLQALAAAGGPNTLAIDARNPATFEVLLVQLLAARIEEP